MTDLNAEQQLAADYMLYLIEEKKVKLPPQEIMDKLTKRNDPLKFDFTIWCILKYLPSWYKNQYSSEKDLRVAIADAARNLKHLFVNPEKSISSYKLSQIIVDKMLNDYALKEGKK